MKIIIDNSTNIVLYADDTLELTEDGAFSDKFRDPNLNTSNCRVEEATLPNYWSGGVWSFENDTWTVVNEDQHVIVVNRMKPPVPANVTRRQAIQAMRVFGVTEANVISAITANVADPLMRDLALIEFKESQVFERNRDLVKQIGPAMGFDLDQLFIFASTL